MSVAKRQKTDAVGGLLAWLESSGTKGLADLDVRALDGGGHGIFTKRDFAKGETIASLPIGCALTAAAAAESELGKAVRACAARLGCQEFCTAEVVLWVYLAVGRRDKAHPWHAYCASLPAESPEPACWPKPLREQLNSTPVGASLFAARRAVQQVWDGFAERLPRELPELVPAEALRSHADLLWARGMVRSRCFPSRLLLATEGPLSPEEIEAEAVEAVTTLAGTAETWGEAPGALLPLFDLLNHEAGARIFWHCDEAAGCIRFVTDEPIGVGKQVYNNYGDRANEELLFSYGFTLRDNSHDSTALVLSVGAEGAVERRGFPVPSLYLPCTFPVPSAGGAARLPHPPPRARRRAGRAAAAAGLGLRGGQGGGRRGGGGGGGRRAGRGGR